MAGGTIKKKVQSIFRCTGALSSSKSNGVSKTGIIFQGSDENFIENGRVLLDERVSLFHGKTNPIYCLSTHELNTNFEDWTWNDSFAGGSWYKCVWEGRPVLVKFFHNFKNESKYEFLLRCCREIVIATQMRIHKNVHKLLACCLETEYPLLIYEYVEKESLLDRILSDDNQKLPALEWKDRLRIAWEISHAVAYLHSAFPRPIIHKGVTPSNVFLDQQNVAKLADFSYSVSIPEGTVCLEQQFVTGTFGYTPPEYLLHGKLVEKSDVYSFGVLLIVLLTGQSPESCEFDLDAPLLYSEKPKECKELRKFLKHKHFSEIFDPVIITYGVTAANEDLFHQQLWALMEIALRCIEYEEDSRPTMEEVSTELKTVLASF